MAYPVVMTVDGTLAGDQAGSGLSGLGACMPGSAPEALFRAIACPAAPPQADGSIGLTDCASRRIEAALRATGLGPADFRFTHPDRIGQAVGPGTKVLLLGSDDPLGRGPLARMIHALWGHLPAIPARSVGRLLAHPAVKEARPLVIAYGGGAWEWLADSYARQELGVDCVVIGEGEATVPELVRRALRGKPLPELVVCDHLAIEKIPRLAGPTAGGAVEVTRACNPPCPRCRRESEAWRSLPLEAILEDVSLNLRTGRRDVVLQSPDIFRYGADGAGDVDEANVCGLFEATARLEAVRSVSASHGSLTGALSFPGLLPRLSGILGLGRPGRPEAVTLQVAIETGSVALARRRPELKTGGFSPEDWPEVVRQGVTQLWENRFAPACSLVVGLPGETEADLWDTIRLVRQLRPIPSLFIPVFFVAATDAGGEAHRAPAEEAPAFVSAAQAELVAAAFEHNLQWIDRLLALSTGHGNGLTAVFRRTAVRALTALATHGARKLAVSLGAHPGPRFGDWFPALTPPPARPLPAAGLPADHPRSVPPSLEAWSGRFRVPGEHRLPIG